MIMQLPHHHTDLSRKAPKAHPPELESCAQGERGSAHAAGVEGKGAAHMRLELMKWSWKMRVSLEWRNGTTCATCGRATEVHMSCGQFARNKGEKVLGTSSGTGDLVVAAEAGHSGKAIRSTSSSAHD